MSGFIGGDRSAHYAYGAARAIHAGEWDRFLVLIDQALRDRIATKTDGRVTPEPSMFAFLPGAPDQPRHQGASQP